MYSPPYNQVEDRAEILAFMRANNFPILVTGVGGNIVASHLPALVEEEGKEIRIDMHMAKNNPQWKEFFDDEVLLVFHGPHAYVSPRWYEDKERVPTWNYAAVHAYGLPRIVSDRQEKEKNQRRLVQFMDPQWLPKHDALSPKYVDMMLEGIVNFEIKVTRLETRWKLSQNRSRREMELIAAELEKAGEHPLAALHRKHFVEK
jgi:transcriptional regulator